MYPKTTETAHIDKVVPAELRAVNESLQAQVDQLTKRLEALESGNKPLDHSRT